MTDDEMTAAIYRRLWPEKGDLMRSDGFWLYQSGYGWARLPDWLHSLDACARDLLPVARERGWRWEYRAMTRAGKEWWCFTAPGVQWSNLAPTGEIARALCKAWLAGPGTAAQA